MSLERSSSCLVSRPPRPASPCQCYALVFASCAKRLGSQLSTISCAYVLYHAYEALLAAPSPSQVARADIADYMIKSSQWSETTKSSLQSAHAAAVGLRLIWATSGK